MKEVLCSAFYLDNLYRGEILCCGAPGNGVFFDRERQKGLRQKLYPGVSRLYSWLPVKRSGSVDGEKLKAQMERILAKLDGYSFILLMPGSWDKSSTAIYSTCRPSMISMRS